MPLTQTERHQFVEHYLPLVAPIARQMHRRLPRSFELEDLESAGRLGLVLAASSYAPGAIRTTTSRAEAAYARLRIRGAICDAVRGERYRYATMRETFSEELGYVYGQGDRAVGKPLLNCGIDQHFNSTLLRVHRTISPTKSTD